MPFQKGNTHGAGRRKGVPNRKPQRLSEIADRLGYTIGEALVMAAANKMPCGTCNGTGKTRFQPAKGEENSSSRVCQSCWGSKMERISAKERAWADAEACSMIYPRLKAVELTGEDGGPIQTAVRVVYVKPKNSDGEVS
jgi:hypothetical protein